MVPINPTSPTPLSIRLAKALAAPEPSIRLQAALTAGSDPDADHVEVLVHRCAVEPDFFVRDMLSWALTRLPMDATLPRIRQELGSVNPRARSQALHTLSKIGDGRAWPWVTRDLMRDVDDDVARTAWRVAVALAPEHAHQELADELALHLGRGSREVRLSLSRALVDLGAVVEPALRRAAVDPDPAVAAHARATQQLRRDPQTGFDAAIEEAKRALALGATVHPAEAEGC